VQYTQQQIDAVFAYNANVQKIFRVSDSKRVLWDLCNGDVTGLREAGVIIAYAEHLAQLKKQVRQRLVADKQL
jgi:hypothetical protein